MQMTVDNSTGSDNNNYVSVTTTQAAKAAFLDRGWLLAAAVEFYSQFAMIVFGVIGTAANALVLYALVVHNARDAKKRPVNWLIINQNLLDLFCCVLLVVTMSFRVSNFYLTGAFGFVFCSLILSANWVYCVLNASVINLMTITVERYLKVVYPFWSKKHLKDWVIKSAIVFSWIAGILSSGPMGFATSVVIDGACLGFYLFFESSEIKNGYGVWNFLTFSVIPLIVFVCCYGHMVMVMRRQMRVMAGHNVGGGMQAQSASSQAQSKRIKWNIIKTMIIVSAFFSVCWFPVNIYLMVIEDLWKSSKLVSGYLLMVCLPYVNCCMNPFIYATKHEGVRRILARMIIWRRHDSSVASSAAAAPRI